MRTYIERFNVLGRTGAVVATCKVEGAQFGGPAVFYPSGDPQLCVEFANAMLEISL